MQKPARAAALSLAVALALCLGLAACAPTAEVTPGPVSTATPVPTQEASAPPTPTPTATPTPEPTPEQVRIFLAGGAEMYARDDGWCYFGNGPTYLVFLRESEGGVLKYCGSFHDAWLEFRDDGFERTVRTYAMDVIVRSPVGFPA